MLAAEAPAVAQEYLPNIVVRAQPRGFPRIVDVVQRFERADGVPGITFGPYRVNPTFGAGIAADDNIFLARRGRRSDFIGFGQFDVNAESNFTRHALDFFGGAEGGAYVRSSDQNFWIGRVGTNGRLDLPQGFEATTQLVAMRLVEPRDTPDGVGGAEPTPFRVFRGAGTIASTAGLIVASVGGGAQRIEYDDVVGAGGTIIRTREREFQDYFGEGRVGFRYLGPEQIYARVRGNARRYRQPIDGVGFRRDSNLIDAVLGATFDLRGLVAAELFAGVRRQEFEDPRFGTVVRPLIDLALASNPWPTATVTGAVRYDFVDSFSGASPGYMRTRGSLRLAQEVTYDLLAVARVSYEDRRYIQSDRRDRVFGADAGLILRLDRNLYLEAQYLYRQGDSNQATGDYRRNIVLLTARRTFGLAR